MLETLGVFGVRGEGNTPIRKLIVDHSDLRVISLRYRIRLTGVY
jgi:hypothetical protein